MILISLSIINLQYDAAILHTTLARLLGQPKLPKVVFHNATWNCRMWFMSNNKMLINFLVMWATISTQNQGRWLLELGWITLPMGLTYDCISSLMRFAGCTSWSVQALNSCLYVQQETFACICPMNLLIEFEVQKALKIEMLLHFMSTGILIVPCTYVQLLNFARKQHGYCE